MPLWEMQTIEWLDQFSLATKFIIPFTAWERRTRLGNNSEHEKVMDGKRGSNWKEVWMSEWSWIMKGKTDEQNKSGRKNLLKRRGKNESESTIHGNEWKSSSYSYIHSLPHTAPNTGRAVRTGELSCQLTTRQRSDAYLVSFLVKLVLPITIWNFRKQYETLLVQNCI